MRALQRIGFVFMSAALMTSAPALVEGHDPPRAAPDHQVTQSKARHGIGRADPGCRIVCLDEGDHGRTVFLDPGDFIHILLITNPSTGYAWNIEELDQEIVLPLCSASIQHFPDRVGSPSDLKWFFQAEETGETVLVLKYYRPWMGPDSAEKTVVIHFVVE